MDKKRPTLEEINKEIAALEKQALKNSFQYREALIELKEVTGSAEDIDPKELRKLKIEYNQKIKDLTTSLDEAYTNFVKELQNGSETA